MLVRGGRGVVVGESLLNSFAFNNCCTTCCSVSCFVVVSGDDDDREVVITIIIIIIITINILIIFLRPFLCWHRSNKKKQKKKKQQTISSWVFSCSCCRVYVVERLYCRSTDIWKVDAWCGSGGGVRLLLQPSPLSQHHHITTNTFLLSFPIIAPPSQLDLYCLLSPQPPQPLQTLFSTIPPSQPNPCLPPHCTTLHKLVKCVFVGSNSWIALPYTCGTTSSVCGHYVDCCRSH